MFEKLVFNIIAFSMFVIIFLKMIRKNDTSYLIILGIEVIGIAINFIELFCKLQLNTFLRIFIYILAIVIPIGILICDYKKFNLKKIFNLAIAKFLISIKKNKEAKKVILNLLEEYPECKEAHKLLAQIYENEGGLRKAIDEYVKVVDLDSNAYDSYFKIAVLLKEFGNKEDSMNMLRKLVNKKPDYLEATIELSDMLCQEERYKEALNLVNESLKYNPNNYDIYYSLGMIYTLLNDFSNAKIAYEKAATINSIQHNTDYDIAMIELILGELEEAEAYFNRCINDEELSPLAYYNLSKIFIIKGEKETSAQFLNLAIELDNNLYKKAMEESIFIPIKGLINYPSLDEEDIEPKKMNLKEKEIKVIKHLEDTYNIVGKLNTKDIGTRYIAEIKEKEKENFEMQR